MFYLWLFVFFKKMYLELKLFVQSFCSCFPEAGTTFFLKISTASFLGNTSSQILETIKLWEEVKKIIEHSLGMHICYTCCVCVSSSRNEKGKDRHSESAQILTQLFFFFHLCQAIGSDFFHQPPFLFLHTYIYKIL